MAQISNDDIKRIARHFLLSSPAGEMEEVLTDVRALVADDELLNECITDIFHTYNTEQLVAVAVSSSDKKLVLSKHGEVDQTHFKDPRTAKVVTVDHLKSKVTEEADDEPESEDVQKKRELLQAAIDKYTTDFYEDGSSTVFALSATEFIVCISSARFKTNNFWSGRWRSVWHLNFQSEKKVKLSGTMKINIHYYEDGNVQLNASFEHGEVVDAPKEDAVAAALKKAENSFQNKLESVCSSMSSTTFKALRRALPVSRDLFNFGSGAHKLAGELMRK